MSSLPDLYYTSQADRSFSDYSGAQTKLPKILLNGNNICMASATARQYEGLANEF